jgi:hypothetical protein
VKPWCTRFLLCFGTIVALDQFAQFALLRDGYLRGHRIAPFDPPIFAPIQSQSLARIREHLATGEPPLSALDFDAELGWCPKSEHRSQLYQYDWARCRIGNAPLPVQRTPGRRRVVAVGCSFTLGAEVGAKDTWAAQLERLAPDLEIANLGVGGYGLDQALMRLRRDGLSLEPDEIWLGVQPEAMARVVTTYMPALSRWGFPVGFKPRFELAAGDELRLVPMPVRTLGDIARLMSSQSDFIAAVGSSDRWVAGNEAAYARLGSSWLHHSSLARFVLTSRERRGRHIGGELPDPESEIFRLTHRICRAAREEAERAGARFRVWVFPDRADLVRLDASGSAYWARWVEALRQEGFDVFDLTPALQSAGGARDPRLWAPQTHYSPDGNRVVAEALAAYLAQS